ncbi:hypothetical protein [Pontibacter arcticus]|uniref:hypothetical protein n=1 Tax=Pontibacter arcticus TaxID=2080288 RepID=UPI001EEF7920|nr:hypothetical protein [Pontibacter arcticus]
MNPDKFSNTLTYNKVWRFVLKSKFILLIPLFILSAAMLKPVPEAITLKAEPFPFKPTEFYVATVTDERTDKKAVAYLLDATSGKPKPVDLKGGGLVAMKAHLQQNLQRNAKLRPVSLRIKEYKITEKPTQTGRIEGKLAVKIAFDLQREDETLQLVEYTSGATYDRPISDFGVVEPVLRKSLENGLVYFNAWINREANKNELLAKGLKIRFKDYNAAEEDTVFYTSEKLLTWQDFLGAPSKPSNYGAAVFTSFAYEGNTNVKNAMVEIDLLLKVYVLRSSSWVRETSRDAYSLNHEQRHFDITKLVTERFKQTLHPDSLTIADYNSQMQYKFLESYKEMNRMQDQYDAETRNGLDQAAQHRWNQKLDEELAKFAVKKKVQ